MSKSIILVIAIVVSGSAVAAIDPDTDYGFPWTNQPVSYCDPATERC